MPTSTTSPTAPTGYFPFVERVLIVVFAVLLTSVPTTFIEEGFGSAESMLLIAVLLLYVDAYIVLHTYHVRLGIPLDLPLMLSDVVIVGLYVTVVRLIQSGAAAELEATRAERIDSAMILAIVVFLLLFVRQLVPYLNTSQQALAGSGVRRSSLLTTMVADFIGAGISAAVLLADPELLGLSIDVWAWVAFAVSILYFVVKYLDLVQVQFGRGREREGS